MAKKIMAFGVLLLLLMAQFTVAANAVQTAVVYGEAVTTKPNSIFFVPVSIKNNPGIMGYKITVNYDPDVLSLPAISRGTVTETGTLNDSIGVSENGTVDVVWTNDTQIAKDGTLFVISFNVDATEAASTEIKLSFSQPDTFNEAYEDVVFDCKTISVSFSEDEEASNVYQGEIKEPDYKDVIIAFDSAIKDMPFDSIKNIDRDFDAEILESVNNTLNIMTGTQNYFSSVDEIIGAYKAAVATDFVNTSCEAVDPAEIDNVIANALQSAGVDSIDKLSAEKKAEFVAAVEQGLGGQAADVEIISDSLTEDEAIEAIIALKETNEFNKSNGIPVVPPVQETGKKLTAIIIAASAAVVVVMAAIAVVIRLKQKKIKEAKTNEKNG